MATEDEFTFRSIVNSLTLPTLEDISTVAIAIQLLEDEEVKKIYFEHFSAERPEDKLSDSSVRELTSVCKTIQLPDILQDKVVRCFHWIRDQYFKWIHYVIENLPKLQVIFSSKTDYITHVINSVKWGMGAIDTEKSLQQIFLLENIKDDEILSGLFVVASRYCLEDILKILWEKMSTCRKKKLFDDCKARDYYAYYWTCKMSGDMREFMKDISSYLKEWEYLDADMDFENPNNYALVLHIFKGDISGVKYFNRLSNIDIEDMVCIIRKFFKELDHDGYYSSYCSWEELEWCAEKIPLLLGKIKDESILKEIFDEFFKVFLVMSVLHWPWRKFLLKFTGVWRDSIDEILIYDLITQLVEDVKMEKADICEVKIFLKNMPNKVKKSFGTFISNRQDERDFEYLWINMTNEVLDIFLKDEELRNILTPYENEHILECIDAERYDLIDFWLQKCLVSEEAIISYFENFIQTESVEVINNFTSSQINHLNQFLEWAFKYEDLMNRDKVSEIKDELMNESFVELFEYNLDDEEVWEGLKKLMDWMLRNRNHEYEDEFVNWKQKVIEKIFHYDYCTFNNDFKNAVCAFLSYGVNDSRKVKIMMEKADLNEGEICSYNLRKNFGLVDEYLSVVEGCGVNIFLTKNKILQYMFKNFEEIYFEDEEFWIDIRKLLYWNCKSDQEMESKVEEIKKAIISECAPECIVSCMRKEKEVNYTPYRNRVIATCRPGSDKPSNDGMDNILEFLFEKKIEDEEWSRILAGLKMGVIEILNSDDFWKGETYDYDVIRLIKWGDENENIRKGIWDVKKYFIEWLKKNINVEIISKMISDTNFFPSFLKGDETKPDFEKVLWDLKEFLVNEVTSDDDDVLILQLIDNQNKGFFNFSNWNCFPSFASFLSIRDKARPDFKNMFWGLTQFLVNKVISDDNEMSTRKLPKNFADFLNWNCSDEGRIYDLKIKLLVRLFQVKTDKLSILSDFFDRCISKNTNSDLKSDVLNFKKGILDTILSKYSKDWNEEYFKRLDKFLSLHLTGDEKDLKKTAVENFATKSCCQCLIDRNVSGLKAFMKWAEIKNEESIKNFKINILIKILDEEYDKNWEDEQFWEDIHNFLCDGDDRGFVESASKKLDIFEIYLFPVFEKLLAEKDRHKLKPFLRWFSDRSVKSSE